MLLFTLASFFGIFATAGTRRLSLLTSTVKQPDPFVPGHIRPVASLGGLGIAAAIAATLGVERSVLDASRALLVGSVLFLLAGLLDDILGLRPAVKLALQVVAGSAAAALGLTLALSGNAVVDGILAVVWLVVVVNAVNVADVADGLVAGVAVVALLALGLITQGPWSLELVAAGACLGFLFFNRPRASIFLGDTGSSLIGFLLGGFALSTIGEGAVWHRVSAAVLILGVPLFDLFFVVAVRAGKGMPFWRGSSDHFALRLQAAGFSLWQTVLIAWFAAFMFSTAGWAVLRVGRLAGLMLMASVFSLLVLGSRLLTQWGVDAELSPPRE
jgi:UDP-GlcNAc:undecaprenyl-phosphate GlcNAc-1-phosphate transferase